MFIGATGFSTSNIALVLYGDVPLDLSLKQEVNPCSVTVHDWKHTLGFQPFEAGTKEGGEGEEGEGGAGGGFRPAVWQFGSYSQLEARGEPTLCIYAWLVVHSKTLACSAGIWATKGGLKVGAGRGGRGGGRGQNRSHSLSVLLDSSLTLVGRNFGSVSLRKNATCRLQSTHDRKGSLS